MVEHTTPAFDTFSFTHRSIVGRRIRLGYQLASRSGPTIDFEETLDVPESLGPLASGEPAVAEALCGLHLAAGTSYWKTSIPKELAAGDAALSTEDASFWTDVYTLGLGEFFYRNQIDPTGRVSFRATSQAAPRGRLERPPTGPALVLWGGGKDSVVSHEVLAQAGEAHELLSIGNPDWVWVRRSAEASGARLHVVTRRLDPKLMQLNEAGAWNGHVPVSAVLAFAGVLVALLTGRRAVIASNEASASHGNATWHGIEVNHQWSKSIQFERLARRWLKDHIGDGPEYVSLLRPLTELRIVKAFAGHPRYFEAVTSCNTNFKQHGPAPRRFCLTCPKCVFVALMARPWLDDHTYHTLFSGDPLADPANVTLIEELLGVRGVKPFDCVGTPEETAAAIHLARTAGRAIPHGVMTAFARAAASQDPGLAAAASRVLARSNDHELSKERLVHLDDYLSRH